MSDEMHEDVSPLHAVKIRIEQRMEMNERHMESHPNPNVRHDAGIRVEVYRLVQCELRQAIDEAADIHVGRVVAGRIKDQAVATQASVKAMKAVAT